MYCAASVRANARLAHVLVHWRAPPDGVRAGAHVGDVAAHSGRCFKYVSPACTREPAHVYQPSSAIWGNSGRGSAAAWAIVTLRVSALQVAVARTRA